jgi:hypothetical protein
MNRLRAPPDHVILLGEARTPTLSLARRCAVDCREARLLSACGRVSTWWRLDSLDSWLNRCLIAHRPQSADIEAKFRMKDSEDRLDSGLALICMHAHAHTNKQLSNLSNVSFYSEAIEINGYFPRQTARHLQDSSRRGLVIKYSGKFHG